MLSSIRLFKALPIEREVVADNPELMKKTLEMGFIFDPRVVANYPDTKHLIDLVNQIYGRNSEELNQSFHKSFAKVRDASMQQLVYEQIIHYLTTYGAERLGVYDERSVYIPNEVLEAPELQEGIRLVVIRGLTKDELKAELTKLLSSGIALHEQTITDALDIATFVGFDENDIDTVKNKEAKVALYNHLDIVPDKPVEFLRYAVYRSTNKTLLIKNKGLLDEIKSKDNLDVARYFDIYEKEIGLQHLAEIFYRYKPIFLAFRTNGKLKRAINRIRRLAKVNHKPMQEDLLNTITARLQRKDTPDAAKFTVALTEANIFRKIRLAYALKFRTTDADSVLYRVRNGKSYAKEFAFSNKKGAQAVYDVILKSIVDNVRPNVEGKKVFIPNGVKYALPATEKQFTGNLPTGTYVEVTEDIVCGIHWENVDKHRIDLDLSVQNADGKIGWDASYRSNQNDLYFSGDITDAPLPNGASEVFHVGSVARGSWIMNVNYYNFDPNISVPFKIFVAHEDANNVGKNYTIDPNKILALSNTVIDVKQKTLGIIVASEGNIKFYFTESNLGKSVTARNTTHSEQARKYLLNYYTDSIILNDILVAAGAIVIETNDEADVDLSPEAIDKTTILNLLGGA